MRGRTRAVARGDAAAARQRGGTGALARPSARGSARTRGHLSLALRHRDGGQEIPFIDAFAPVRWLPVREALAKLDEMQVGSRPGSHRNSSSVSRGAAGGDDHRPSGRWRCWCHRFRPRRPRARVGPGAGDRRLRDARTPVCVDRERLRLGARRVPRRARRVRAAARPPGSAEAHASCRRARCSWVSRISSLAGLDGTWAA
jgi:hypothetical protein